MSSALQRWCTSRRLRGWLLVAMLPIGMIVPTVSATRQAAMPQTSGDVEASYARIVKDGAKATIRRDRFGVPHIVAETEETAAFAHGYVTAEDHGAALAQLFLHARGAVSSVFGERYLEEDVRVRMLGIHEEAEKRFSELPLFMQRILDGYAAGYTFYLEKHREEFPNWATPVTGIDVLAHSRAVLLRFALDMRPWTPTPPASTGSNMWAIGRPLSASGHGMLMANPHVKWDGWTVFHEVHLTVPGLLNVSGGTFIGVPVVTIGFNDVLGWSHTVNAIDADDVYELTLDETESRYLYDGVWQPLRKRTVSVEVKTGDGTRTETRTVYSSHHGPVIRIEHGKAFAYKSANLAAVNFLTQWNAMGKATSLTAFKAAVNMQQLPMFNLMYADREGNIWYVFNGRIPIRPPGFSWAGVVPGNTSKTEWFVIHPLSDLPQLLNPKTGYLQNCNDAPWFTNLEQPIERAPFTGHIRGDGLGWRSQESLRILSGERTLTLERLMRHKFDSSLPIATRIKDDLLPVLKARNHEPWREALRVLEAWDDAIAAESRGALLFVAWWEEYVRSVERPFQRPWSSTDPISTPDGLADPAKALGAFDRAIARTQKRFGRLDVAWGDVHRLRRGTLDLPLGGSNLTLQNVMFGAAPDGKQVANGGDSYVLAVEFTAEGPRAFSIVPASESSNPQSAHFADQAALYARKQFKPSWFVDRDIAANLERQYHPDR